jgi:hypothetical protein
VSVFEETKADEIGQDELLRDDRELLSPRQITALEVRLSGGTQQEAATQAEVDQRTVRRWESHNYAYIAEWNRRLAQRNQQSGERMHEIWDLATENMVAALRDKDPSVTLAVFRAMVQNPPKYPVGPLTRKEVRRSKVQDLLNQVRQDRLDLLEQSSLPPYVADVVTEIADDRDELTSDIP